MTDIPLTGIALVVLLGTLVYFHEFGHFAMAKLVKIKVEEFAFGFGPVLVRLFKRGDTEYTIHAVPLGGFVKLTGMEPGEESIPDGFQSKPAWKRYLTILAGPFMSFVLAYLVFSTLGLTVGLPTTGEAINRVDLIQPGSRADRAGLREGDVIVKINDERIETGNEMVQIIHDSAGRPLVIVVNRDGRTIRIRATPGPGKIGNKTVGLLGFIPAQKLQRVGLVESFRVGNSATVSFAKTIVSVLFSREVKNAVGGPLAIVDATQTSVRRGANGFLQIMGMLSLSLGVVNLLPIPVLDGGWMMLLVVEAIRRKRLSPRTWEVAQRVGMAVIGIIFVLIMYLDLTRVATGKLFR